MLFGSFHLILFVSSTNYFKIVRRQCCLLEDFKSHLDSLTLGGLVDVVAIVDNSDGNFDDDDSHDNDNHLHSQLLVSWL